MPGRTRHRGGLVIGLTGGMAAGKSHLAGLLRRGGAAYYSVDEAAHDLYRPGRPAARALVRIFGPGIERAEGGIDRGRLAAAVAGQPGGLARLEALLHPRLRRAARRAVDRLRRRQAVTVIEAGPLLFTLGLHHVCDLTVVVQCPRGIRIARLRAARHWSSRQAVSRLKWFAAAERRLARQAARAARVMTIDGSAPPARLARWAGRIVAGA